MVTGEWPTGLIDHQNGDGTDNRWANLRLATSSLNAANSRRRSDNTSGFKGVSRCRGARWRASIQLNGKFKHLGHFDTPEEAHAVYCAAAANYFGEFAHHGGKER
jgi:hypothetical protein